MVFISYSSRNIEYAMKIKEILDNSGVICWMAPDSISVGGNYGNEVPKAIESCDGFILILTKEAQQSNFVPKEIDRAIKNGKTIFPLKFDSSEISLEFDFFLCNVQIKNMKIQNNTIDCTELLGEINKIKSFSSKLLSSPYWGPIDRKTYLWDKESDHPVFNSILNNPLWGDERRFIRIRKAGEAEFVDKINLYNGEECEIMVLYHNNASEELNATGKGIARDVRLNVQFPSYLKKDQSGLISAFISASNSDPTEV